MVIGLVPVLANLLTTSDGDTVVVTNSATILTKLAGARGFPDEVQKHAVYAALVAAAVSARSYDALTEVSVRPLHDSVSCFTSRPVCSVCSRPSDHYFRSVCLSVCLFVCLCRVFLSRV